MQLLLMNSRSGIPSAPASALKMLSHTPRSTQRTKRLYNVFLGPYMSSQSAQRLPQRSACTISLSIYLDLATYVARQQRRDTFPLRVGKPEEIRHHTAS